MKEIKIVQIPSNKGDKDSQEIQGDNLTTHPLVTVYHVNKQL